MLYGLMQGADHDLVRIWQKMNAKRFDNIMLNAKTVGAKAAPNGKKKIASAKAGVAVTDRGFINMDIQMRTNVPHRAVWVPPTHAMLALMRSCQSLSWRAWRYACKIMGEA